MDQKQQVQQYMRQFNLSGAAKALDTLVSQAEAEAQGYLQYTHSFLQTEVNHRLQKDIAKRMKTAALPRKCDLSQYDPEFSNGLSLKRLNQLKELHWLDQIYNVILMGPSGVGKTFISSGLCLEAIRKGYKAYFRTMDQLMATLKMKEITASAKSEYKRLQQAHLIVLDDIMLFPVEKKDAVALFGFINQIYEKTSLIITTNKKPVEWAQMLDDEVLATALLDRLLYQCEVVSLTGKSYRMKHRKTIFDNQNN